MTHIYAFRPGRCIFGRCVPRVSQGIIMCTYIPVILGLPSPTPPRRSSFTLPHRIHTYLVRCRPTIKKEPNKNKRLAFWSALRIIRLRKTARWRSLHENLYNNSLYARGCLNIYRIIWRPNKNLRLGQITKVFLVGGSILFPRVYLFIFLTFPFVPLFVSLFVSSVLLF